MNPGVTQTLSRAIESLSVNLTQWCFVKMLYLSFENMVCGVSGKNPVSEGEVSTIEIQRGEDDQLNISVVGGADTPLVSRLDSLPPCSLSFSCGLIEIWRYRLDRYCSICPQCGRICASNFGLLSHLRRPPQWGTAD